MMTLEERNANQRMRRKQNGNIHTLKYEKTKKGFLVRLYRNMQSSVTGVQKLKHHLYEGKSLLDRDIFYNWALNNPVFNKLFDEWESQSYPRRLCPSVDRIDSTRGYELDNMEWVEFHENCRRGTISKFNSSKK